MPTSRDGDIQTNSPWTIKSKNKSTARDMVTEQKSATNQVASKNRGSLDKETPHQTTGNRNKSDAVTSLDSQRVSNSQKAERHRNNERKGSGDLFGEKSVNAGGTSNNKGSAPEHPEARVNSGKTKVHTYPAGRNRGRNYKS